MSGTSLSGCAQPPVHEAAAAALVGPARRLHHAIERQADEHNDSVTYSAVAR
jgi:hypothetical protein